MSYILSLAIGFIVGRYGTTAEIKLKENRKKRAYKDIKKTGL